MSPAQWYCLIFGIVLLALGIIGFFVDSNTDVGNDVRGDELLGIPVNLFHNLVHALTGLVALALVRNRPAARLFALTFGAVYLLVAIYGFVTGDNVIALVPVNGWTNVVHLVISLAGLAAGFLTREEPEARTTA